MPQNVDNHTMSVENSDVHVVWENCLDIIRSEVNSQAFQTWFLPITPLKATANELTIQVPSQFFYDWVEEHYPKTIRNALKEVLGINAIPIYSVLQPQEEKPALVVSQPTHKSSGHYMGDETSLNSRYTFNNFVEGKGNQFAKAAARAVAEAPGGTSFNPLVLYGGVGLGKTHLAQAIGNLAQSAGAIKRIRYVSSEKFTIEFINSIQNNRTSEFSQIYRNVDLLLVDDIQFFMSKERTQEEFFHTFNTLHQKGKQIVLTSDRPPKEMHGLEERLISRFQWGLVTEVQPPDLETRIAILQQKADFDGLDLSMEIIEFIASNITSNIRELEGALIKLMAYSSLQGVDITIDLVKMVLKDILILKRKDISIEDIQRVVCEYFNIPDDLLRGKSRKKEIAFSRQVAMYLSKQMTHYSLKSIGLHFGGRDHTTVIHAIRTIDNLVSEKKDIRVQDIVESVKKKIEVASL
ncbi:chromosomal replication initiator protein DnaA [candidate division KSB1 bacterium]|nr:chromosomal replication initiator protein DnaA [candidate division KSB1 bacterium]